MTTKKANEELKEMQEAVKQSGGNDQETENAKEQLTTESEVKDKKSNTTEITEERTSSKSLTSYQHSMLANLKEQEHVEILIPKDPSNPNDTVQIVGVNGVIYAIPKGKPFKVPKAIRDTWLKSYNRTQEARERIRMTEMGEDTREIEIRR